MDYRLSLDLIDNPYLLEMINYDQDMFTYTKKKGLILDTFKRFIEDNDLFIIDNKYTKDYLLEIKNKKISVFDYLSIPNNDDSFDLLIKKYNLERTNHLVDLLYEAITFHDS